MLMIAHSLGTPGVTRFTARNFFRDKMWNYHNLKKKKNIKISGIIGTPSHHQATSGIDPNFPPAER